MDNKLIGIAIQLAITAGQSKYFKDKDTKTIAEWAIGQLNSCGYPTLPVGSAWAVPCKQHEHDEYYNRRMIGPYVVYDYTSPERIAELKDMMKDA